MLNDNRSDRDARVTLGDNDSMRTQAQGGLAHLDDLDDFQIAEGEPDIRGWDVRGADGQKLGEVEDLLVDTVALKVRYIEVKLDKDIARDMAVNASSSVRAAAFADRDVTPSPTIAADAAHDDDERYVLVPIGAARLDDDKDDVVLDAQAAHMAGIPAYRRSEPVTRDYESNVLRGYPGHRGSATETPATGTMASATTGEQGGIGIGNSSLPADRSAASPTDDFYTGRSFDDRSFFGGRRQGRDDDSYLSRSDRHETADAHGEQRRDIDGSDPRGRDGARRDRPSDADRIERDDLRDDLTDRAR